MKVAIIGAGFGGLTAAYHLSKKGVQVSVFETIKNPGGLAVGFKEKTWEWTLEEHYHHLFTSDDHVLNLAKEVGQKIIFKSPVSSTFLDSQIFRLDSVVSLLKFNKLSILDRLRTGVVIAYLKFTPFWQPLEKITAYEFIRRTMGERSWDLIWHPLFRKKFGELYEKKINASWFWARIKKRSAKLGYPEGGFLEFAKKIEKEVQKMSGEIFYNYPVEYIEKHEGGILVSTKNANYSFDKVICTIPSKLFINVVRGLPEDYKEKLSLLKSIGTINLVMSLKRSFLDDGSYWLNINEISYPILALVEHTNFMDKIHFNDENLVYVANYLPPDHKYFSLDKDQLFKIYFPYLKKINTKFENDWIRYLRIFKSPHTQPIVEVDHSKILPSISTPIKGIYLTNMEQIYPWDRGTNYAVEMGKKVTALILND